MNHRKVKIALATACMTLMAAGSAHAATTFGSVAQPTTFGYVNNSSVTTVLDPGGGTHAGSPVAGVLVKAQIRTRGGGGAGFIRVLRLQSPPVALKYSFLNVAEVPVTVSADATVAGHVTEVDTRIPISGGDRLGVVFPNDNAGNIRLANRDLTGECAYGGSDHPVGSTVELSASGCNQNIPLLAGVVEADADGDGYGDESQDACPADAARQTGPCAYDAAVSIPSQHYKVKRTATKTAVTFTIRVTNLGQIDATGVTLALKRGRPISKVRVLSRTGCVAALDRKSCTIATLAAGASVDVLVRIEGRKPGRGKFSAAITSGATGPMDSNSANDKAAKTFRLRLKK
jgi:hypothetical protein